MAKSKILKELANNEITIDIALKRLLLICNDLNYEEVFSWAEKELNGYSAEEPIPEYRNLGVGKIVYSGLKGSMSSCLKLSNQPLPIQWIPDKYMDLICNNYERCTIANIIERAKSGNIFSADLTSLAGGISVGIVFTSISQKFDSTNYVEIANKDHIHMLVSIPPKYSVSQIMGYLKGKSSLMIFEKYANMKYKYGNRHFWCRGYYVDTVGRNKKAIAEYIRNQLQEDISYDQMSLVEYVDPFTGKQVKEGK